MRQAIKSSAMEPNYSDRFVRGFMWTVLGFAFIGIFTTVMAICSIIENI